ncbi:hypothetical protein CF392_13180 [Tamilnaduibacter salinus]|uniref:Uncharacterized protein n=1 Tax=Tamilnaduibacter salinus TaxID=1484056 RepID=A0A2A2I150_9GAMM|nr:hypothetical protein [Tamilnaduibacter salinus]PAV25016.1 hypothetical protein CF392_13180 [Tamilnaduibacter salinus]
MIRNLAVATVALVLAGFLGWFLAETEPVTGGFTGSEALPLPAEKPGNKEVPIDRSLKTLYQRAAWSAVAPEEDEAGSDEDEEVALPEGLDRFRLLGILRVAGRQAEVLLKDLNAGDEKPAVFRAAQGDNLQDSGVVLARIGQQKISLEQAGEVRELFLFPRSPTNGRDE